MAVQPGTIKGATLIDSDAYTGSGRFTYLLTVDFPAYTGSTDSGTITGVAAAISARILDGKTRALIASCVPTCVGPGQDTAGQNVFIGTVTISTADLNFNLVNSSNTELTSSTASTGVKLLVTVLES